MDFSIKTSGGRGIMTFEKSSNLLTSVYLSLMIPLGSFFANPKFGSRLHLLRTMGNTARTEALIPDYCKEALQWMLDIGRAKSVSVITQRDPVALPGRINASVLVIQADNSEVTFNTFIPVV